MKLRHTIISFAATLSTVRIIEARALAYNGEDDIVKNQFAESRVIGGQHPDAGEFPYQVFMVRKIPDGPPQICSGSIINDRHILTAAHCVYHPDLSKPRKLKPTDISVIAGIRTIHMAGLREAAQSGRIRNGSKIIVHPEWEGTEINGGDIAIIRTDLPFRFTSFDPPIQPVAIISKNYELQTEPVKVAGWGVINEENQALRNISKAKISIQKDKICEFLYKEMYNPDNMICAGKPKKFREGTCAGDSGSPLILESQKHGKMDVQVGMVSFGPRICTGSYAVFTKVAAYTDWIVKNSRI